MKWLFQPINLQKSNKLTSKIKVRVKDIFYQLKFIINNFLQKR